MKRIFLIGIIVLLALIATISVNYTLRDITQDSHLQLLSQIEALASDTESGGNIVCRCSKITDQSCATNNKGSQCASGDNIHCEEWNLNCHKNV